MYITFTVTAVGQYLTDYRGILILNKESGPLEHILVPKMGA